MYMTDNGLPVYETYNDLVDAGITYAWEYQGRLYIRVKLTDYFDNTIWIVDKKTKKVSHMFFTEFFEFMDDATPIDPETLKRAS